jgi:hypothetical protein
MATEQEKIDAVNEFLKTSAAFMVASARLGKTLTGDSRKVKLEKSVLRVGFAVFAAENAVLDVFPTAQVPPYVPI